jgi:pyrimidine operon attenuation protein/uracil phosphoribosyltransferase
MGNLTIEEFLVLLDADIRTTGRRIRAAIERSLEQFPEGEE